MEVGQLDAGRFTTAVLVSLGIHWLVLVGWKAPALPPPLPPAPSVLTFDLQQVGAASAPATPIARPLQEAVPLPPPPEPVMPVEKPQAVEPMPPALTQPVEAQRPTPAKEPSVQPVSPKKAAAKKTEQVDPPVAEPVSPTASELAKVEPSVPSSESVAVDPRLLANYQQQLHAWLNRQKQYPMMARRRGLEGLAVLRIMLGPDGVVLSRKLDSATGSEMLDQAALAMVERANPFPAPPENLQAVPFEFVAPVEFRLR
jgi:protein TonB